MLFPTFPILFIMCLQNSNKAAQCFVSSVSFKTTGAGLNIERTEEMFGPSCCFHSEFFMAQNMCSSLPATASSAEHGCNISNTELSIVIILY